MIVAGDFMNKSGWLLIMGCLLISGISPSFTQQLSVIDEEHTKWVDHVLRDIQTLKPGMTRGDLARMFVEEGGISTRAHRKYVYRTCPYIKVDIEFSPSDRDPWKENPEDKIVNISRPYLEYSIMD